MKYSSSRESRLHQKLRRPQSDPRGGGGCYCRAPTGGPRGPVDFRLFFERSSFLRLFCVYFVAAERLQKTVFSWSLVFWWSFWEVVFFVVYFGCPVFATAGGVGFRAEIIKSENVWAEIIQAFFNFTSGMEHLASLSAVVQENVLLPQATIRDSARESALAGAFERTGAC